MILVTDHSDPAFNSWIDAVDVAAYCDSSAYPLVRQAVADERARAAVLAAQQLPGMIEAAGRVFVGTVPEGQTLLFPTLGADSEPQPVPASIQQAQRTQTVYLLNNPTLLAAQQTLSKVKVDSAVSVDFQKVPPFDPNAVNLLKTLNHAALTNAGQKSGVLTSVGI